MGCRYSGTGQTVCGGRSQTVHLSFPPGRCAAAEPAAAADGRGKFATDPELPLPTPGYRLGQPAFRGVDGRGQRYASRICRLAPPLGWGGGIAGKAGCQAVGPGPCRAGPHCPRGRSAGHRRPFVPPAPCTVASAGYRSGRGTVSGRRLLRCVYPDDPPQFPVGIGASPGGSRSTLSAGGFLADF